MRAVRYAVAASSLGALALVAFGAISPSADGQTNFVQDGEAGFVVSEIEFAMWDENGGASACPGGLSRGYANVGDVLPNDPDLQRGAQETDAEYGQRASGRIFRNMQNLCMRPEQGAPDANWKTVAPNFATVGGIDLDGQNSTLTGRPAAGTCAHNDFRTASGARGVDNQFLRVAGCTRGFQTNGQGASLTTGMLTGTWGILIALSGVDDPRNDNDVQISFYANADPIDLSPTRQPVPGATYSAHSDPRFRATARARIVNGVLTSEPVDAQFQYVYETIRVERPLRGARIQATLTADGGLEGYLAGYTPVEAMYDVQFGFRNGVEVNGEAASPQLLNTRAIGTALAADYTCHGVYHALQQNADGHRDPATGRCTSISTQYRFRAAPAFVVD